MSGDLYCNPVQARRHEPTDYENGLGDALEAAFADGVHELPALVARLNADGIKAPDGADWTEAGFERAMTELGA
jgi:Recombinase-like helix-turn-helix domain